MLRKKLSFVLLTLSLLIAFTAVGSVVVDAEKIEIQQSKKKRCDNPDIDRNALEEDEERTYGDCTGTVPTPEPVSILLFSAGLAGVGFAARRRLRRSE